MYKIHYLLEGENEYLFIYCSVDACLDIATHFGSYIYPHTSNSIKIRKVYFSKHTKYGCCFISNYRGEFILIVLLPYIEDTLSFLCIFFIFVGCCRFLDLYFKLLKITSFLSYFICTVVFEERNIFLSVIFQIRELYTFWMKFFVISHFTGFAKDQ